MRVAEVCKGGFTHTDNQMITGGRKQIGVQAPVGEREKIKKARFRAMRKRADEKNLYLMRIIESIFGHNSE